MYPIKNTPLVKENSTRWDLNNNLLAIWHLLNRVPMVVWLVQEVIFY